MPDVEIGRSILRGSTLAASVTLLLSCVTFFKQIILGWLLTPYEFGIFGMAMALTVLVACFQDSSILKVLIQKGDRFVYISDAGFLLSIIFNVGATIMLIIAASIYGKIAGEPILVYVVIFHAWSLLISSFVTVFKAEIVKNLQFKKVSQINLSVHTFSHCLVVILAYFGAGVFSFVIPLVFAKAAELWIYSRISKEAHFWRFWERFSRDDIFLLIRDLRWLMLSALAVALILKGDYFVLGLMVDVYILGIYFFGFQLTTAFSTLISGSLNQVFLPTLSKIKNDKKRMGSAFIQSIRGISVITFPLFIVLSIAISPLIHYVWGGRWDEAIIVSQLILLIVPIRILTPVGRSFLEASGQWSYVTKLLFIDAIALLVGAIIGAYIGSLTSIVFSICLARLTLGIIQLTIIPKKLDICIFKTFHLIGPIVVVSFLSFGFAIYLTDFHVGTYNGNIMLYLNTIILFVIIYSIFAAMFLFKDHYWLYEKILNYIK